MIPTLEWTQEGVRFLDQTRLPLEETYVLATSYQQVADVITTMVVRGAPAIGVYCLKHTIAARERMRQKLKYRRRLRNSSSYLLEKEVRSKRQHNGGRVTAARRSKNGNRLALAKH